MNVPGPWHDTKLAAASGLHSPRLTCDTPTGLALIGDSAFPRVPSELRGKIIRSRKANEFT